MSLRSTWLEVALNGPWGRDRQPNIPVEVDAIVEEGLACVEAGAAIIHVHAYDPATGRQNDDPDTYQAIIDGIRRHSPDTLVYGTLPFAGDMSSPHALDARARFAHVETLAARGAAEWTVLDPGTTNITHLDWIAAGEEGFTYANPEAHVRYGLELCARAGLVPSYAVYEPGFLRQGARLHAAVAATAGAIPTPVYRFMFSDGFTFGFPPRTWALDAYLNLLAEEAPAASWMVAGLAVDILPLAGETIRRGGHVRVGLEDAPLGSAATNAGLAHAAARAIADAGSRCATPEQVRSAWTA